MKLVRDKQPELLPHMRVEYSTAPPPRIRPMLLQKLLEEVGELVAANGQEDVLKELGDIQEVLWALGERSGITREQIMLQAYGKLEGRGGFTKAVTMECVKAGTAPTPVPSDNRSDYGTYGGVGYSG